jgi:hypothetical protein
VDLRLLATAESGDSVKSQYSIDQHSAALLVEYEHGSLDYSYELIPGSWSDVVAYRDALAEALERLRVWNAGAPYETDEAWEEAAELSGGISEDDYYSIGPSEVIISAVVGYAIYLRPLGYVEVQHES